MTYDVQLAEAVRLAVAARDAGDHPYGAVIMLDGASVGERNRVVSTSDPTAHSEVMAIRTTAARHGLDSMVGATMVTSFEPCPMCLGAILEAGIANLVVGARRVPGEAPLGQYTIEALLALTGRTGDLAVVAGPSSGDLSPAP